ncbi:MAG: lysozyme inhibitor LprI family protein, partial [Luteibacter sp.]
RSEKAIQDRRINKAYGRLMDKLTGSTKESVQLAERAWIDFNTRSVAAETDLGGTDRVANVDVATAELHRYCLRANVLEDYVFSVGQ